MSKGWKLMARRVRIFFIALMGSLFALPAITARAADIASHPMLKGPVTFTKDIAPLVFEHCAICHRPGEVAPFSLLAYSDVRKHAKQIRELTGARQMPPWKAVEDHGEFRGERRLTDAQIALLKQWVDEG